MKMLHKVILSAVIAGCVTMATPPKANAGGRTGYSNGFYFFTYYTGNGSTSITPNGGNYAASWTSGLSDSLAGDGWWPGSIRNIGYNYGFISGSYNNGGAYGWAPYPNLEWYITDFGSRSGTFKGTVNSDGGTYNVYLGSQGGGPQFNDDRTVDQSKGANHTITMSNHVNYWKAHLGTFGTIRETVIMVESYTGGSGSCNGTCW